ncbi:MAG: RES family NAD+ phosphorylase [Gammaproteobacteria bacterium]|nr:RES family NAD+ phosphorylase [Gammaproteobacteria bacterium]
MKSGWRVCSSTFANTTHQMMSGEGAFLGGGRWNSRGIRVVYLGSTLSLATLEVLVHLQKPTVLASYSRLEVFFNEDDVMSIDQSAFPSNWSASTVNSPVQYVGDDWVKRQASLVLEVPSAVTPGEKNYLVNVEHPRFSNLKYGNIEAFNFDDRLLGLIT